MKIKPLFSALLASAALSLTLIAPAMGGPVPGQGTWETTLQARDLDGNGVTDAFYDTDLNITWLRNSYDASLGTRFDRADGFTDSLMTLENANSWANDLVFGGYSGWRLPTMVDTGSPGCNWSNSGTDCGYNVQTATSEIAHLFYVTLGNKADYAPVTGDYNWFNGLRNTGNFEHLTEYRPYWFGTEDATNSWNAWTFGPEDGLQYSNPKYREFVALAVRPGDVLAATVPEPGTGLLAVAALAGLGALRRRRAVGPVKPLGHFGN